MNSLLVKHIFDGFNEHFDIEPQLLKQKVINEVYKKYIRIFDSAVTPSEKNSIEYQIIQDEIKIVLSEDFDEILDMVYDKKEKKLDADALFELYMNAQKTESDELATEELILLRLLKP